MTNLFDVTSSVTIPELEKAINKKLTDTKFFINFLLDSDDAEKHLQLISGFVGILDLHLAQLEKSVTTVK